MGVKKGQQIELAVSDLAFGGKGFSKVDGLAVFIDQAVPGDVVIARIVKKKKNFAEARIVEMLTPSPHRIAAPCEYSGFCGGCKWQFLDYAQQLVYKRRHVADSFAHIGMIRDIPVHPAIPSERIFGYRNKMEFSCSDSRWLLPEEMAQGSVERDLALGLHVPGTFHKVLDTRACLLQPDAGNRLLDEVKTDIRHSHLPVYGLRSHQGFWRFLVLRHSVFYDQWMVNIVTASENRKAVQPIADRLLARYPEVVSVVNNITARKAGIAVGEYEVQLGGSATLIDRIGSFEFEISANSFFQTNTRGAEKLYATVEAYAGLAGTESVVDLYSGTGTIAIYLSKAAKKVSGVEIVDSAVSDAMRNCVINDVSNCTFVQGDIRKCLAQVDEKCDVMVIDPPRAGMHKDVVKQVLQRAPKRIVYVSCNPATMARDIAMMIDDYAVLEVQPVDMFPHTYHIEAVAKLDRKS